MMQKMKECQVHIDADLETFGKRNVPDDHSESDRDKKERLPVLQYGNSNESDAYHNHYQVLPCHVGEACILQELLQAFYNGIHVIRVLRLLLLQVPSHPLLH